MTCALLGFFSMKNPSLCCEVTFGLRVALQQSGLAKHSQALAQLSKEQAQRSYFVCCGVKA
jgi:hypothetical protein